MKPIKILPEVKAKAMQDFEKFLNDTKTIEDKVSFSVDLGKIMGIDTHPVIQVTAEAWCKMSQLVAATDKEVAWHSLVRAQGDNKYLIYDVIVYPQVVSGASVNTDQQEYEAWLQSQEDDVFNNIRMQGHSHVNMGISPSTTDWNLYLDMLANMTRIPFYIFLIMNKKHDMYVLLYDFEKNICFETKDCIWQVVMSDGQSLAAWEKQAAKAVRLPPAVVTPTVNAAVVSRFSSINNPPVREGSGVDHEDYNSRWAGIGYGGKY